LRELSRRIRDQRVFEIWRQIIEAYATAPERGLPIGALTSQHLANFYLAPLDRFVKETLRVPGYVRYMDDMVAQQRVSALIAFVRPARREPLLSFLFGETSKRISDDGHRGVHNKFFPNLVNRYFCYRSSDQSGHCKEAFKLREPLRLSSTG